MTFFTINKFLKFKWKISEYSRFLKDLPSIPSVSHSISLPGKGQRSKLVHSFVYSFLSPTKKKKTYTIIFQLPKNFFLPYWTNFPTNFRRYIYIYIYSMNHPPWISAGIYTKPRMNPSESQQNLLADDARAPSVQSLNAPTDYALGPVEKHFLLSAERGDCATVKR